MKAYLNKKTAALTFAVLVCAAFFASCGAEERDHLAYQEYPIKAECVLFAGEEEYPFILDVASSDSARLTFIGSRLEGSVIELSSDGALFVCGGYRIPLELARESALRAIISAFSLSSSDMTDVTQSDDALTVGYRVDRLSVKVTLRDNIPSAMELSGGGDVYSLTFNNFTSGSRHPE